MPLIKRCCCSRNLRKGSIIATCWTLVWCLVNIVISVLGLQNLYVIGDDPDRPNIRQTFIDGGVYQAALAFGWLVAIVVFAVFISSVVALAGLLKDCAPLLIPWMVSVFGMILLDCASLIFSIVYLGLTQMLIIFLLMWIITTLINVYCELCVLSQYQELKAERGRHIDYVTRGYNPRRNQAPVQHVHVGGEMPIHYVQSQHTIYSFHSQTLDGETEDKIGSRSQINGIGNGRVLQLRPITSLPADMDRRMIGKGGIELEVVDSIPVIPNGNGVGPSYISSLDGGRSGFAPPIRVKRFRTVSESAVRPPPGSSQGSEFSSASKIDALLAAKDKKVNKRKAKEVKNNSPEEETCFGSQTTVEPEEQPLTHDSDA